MSLLEDVTNKPKKFMVVNGEIFTGHINKEGRPADLRKTEIQFCLREKDLGFTENRIRERSGLPKVIEVFVRVVSTGRRPEMSFELPGTIVDYEWRIPEATFPRKIDGVIIPPDAQCWVKITARYNELPIVGESWCYQNSLTNRFPKPQWLLDSEARIKAIEQAYLEKSNAEYELKKQAQVEQWKKDAENFPADLKAFVEKDIAENPRHRAAYRRFANGNNSGLALDLIATIPSYKGWREMQRFAKRGEEVTLPQLLLAL
jgi:hypothetical protein